MTAHRDHAPDPDQLALEIANQLHAAPRPQAQAGGAAPPALPEPQELADRLRPHLTPEVLHVLGGGGHKFNFANFVKNLNAVLPLITTFIGVFTGVPIPPITLPVPTGDGGPTPTPTPTPA